MTKHTIYGLCEPETDFIRYVGYTRTTLHKRRNAHLREAGKHATCHRHHWLRSILKLGKKPGIIVIEQVTEKTRERREIFWIKKLRVSNNLVNSTGGGDGMLDPSPKLRRLIGRKSSAYQKIRPKHPFAGHKHTEETKAKMREAAKNKDLTSLRRSMKKLRGVPKSEEHRRKIGEGNRGKIRTPEMVARMRETNKGKNNWLGRKHSLESIAKMRAYRLANPRSINEKGQFVKSS